MKNGIVQTDILQGMRAHLIMVFTDFIYRIPPWSCNLNVGQTDCHINVNL